MDAVFLSRLQFGFTTAFHILFPTLTIGLGLFLVILEFLWLTRKEVIHYRLYRFWVKIFAIHFAVGVVTGVVLEFEFGTNFARFSQRVGNVFAPLMAYEGMTAFFLEAGFLGIMLFGWNRVKPVVHFMATCFVSAGAVFSAFWIMAANAWMQTPAGYEIVDGKFHVTSFSEAIFNPAFPTHLSHMVLASFETTAFVVAGISAFFILKNRHVPFYRKSLALALAMAAVCAPLQVVVGDFRGQNVFKHQPAKLAAMEGHWETNTDGGAAFVLFGIPDMKAEKNHFEITVPAALSLLLTHSPTGKVMGLKSFPADERPNALVTYWSFRAMVGIGFWFVFVMAWASWLWRKGRLYDTRLFLKALVLSQPLGFIAVITGWITAEVGRQPWVVYGLMRTREGVSPIAAGNVIWSLATLGLVYAVIGVSYFYYVMKTLYLGPDLAGPIPHVDRTAHPPIEGEPIHRERMA